MQNSIFRKYLITWEILNALKCRTKIRNSHFKIFKSIHSLVPCFLEFVPSWKMPSLLQDTKHIHSFMSSFNRFDFTFYIYIFDPCVIYFKITTVGGNSVLIFHLGNCVEEEFIIFSSDYRYHIFTTIKH